MIYTVVSGGAEVWPTTQRLTVSSHGPQISQISGWTHRSQLWSRAHNSNVPRQGDITRLEMRAVKLQMEIHLDLKRLTASEVEEFIHLSMLGTFHCYTVWRICRTVQGHPPLISAVIFHWILFSFIPLISLYFTTSLHLLYIACCSSIVNSFSSSHFNVTRTTETERSKN